MSPRGSSRGAGGAPVQAYGLAEHPGARPGELARLLNMRPNTVTTIVNALSARELLCRTAAAGDRRAVELTVTETGREAVLAWQATSAAVLLGAGAGPLASGEGLRATTEHDS